jgi:hypothetical protein
MIYALAVFKGKFIEIFFIRDPLHQQFRYLAQIWLAIQEDF